MTTALERVHDKPYAETFRCPAGELCLDFCNTGQGARSGGGEWLAGFRDLVAWLEAAHALGGDTARRVLRGAQAHAADKAWERALQLRSALRRVMDARIDGATPARDDLARLVSDYARAAAYARLEWHGDHADWALDPDAADPAAVLLPILQSAVRLLTSEKLPRVRRCDSPTCGWLFLDETRNRSRRWCDMASCGNLHKVRRHRARQEAAASASRARPRKA